jgi:hypothetical protein
MMDVITIIDYGTAFILISLMTSTASFFWDYCLWPGNIFGGFLPWLAGKISGEKRNEKESKEHYEMRVTDKVKGHGLFKIAGGCPVCSNVYLTTAIYLILMTGINAPFWGLVPVLFGSSLFLRIMLKLD